MTDKEWIARWHQMEARRAAEYAMKARAAANPKRWSLDWWVLDRKVMAGIANDWASAAAMHAHFARSIMEIGDRS